MNLQPTISQAHAIARELGTAGHKLVAALAHPSTGSVKPASVAHLSRSSNLCSVSVGDELPRQYEVLAKARQRFPGDAAKKLVLLPFNAQS